VEWYRRAEDYDLWYSWDPAPERDLVLAASRRWGIAEPRRILEPMCGPGRLLRTMPGLAVGFDIEEPMVRRAARTNPVFRADAARFGVRDGAFDLAFNLIDSFRHLLAERDARSHLRCTARALRAGAVYLLGLEIDGDLPSERRIDRWESVRDGRRALGSVEALGDADPDTRTETIRVAYTIDGAAREFFFPVRTYTRRQFEDLVDDEGSFEIAAVIGRDYDVGLPIELSEVAGSAVVVLRRES
jgi:SAM-dependent methyltransferase